MYNTAEIIALVLLACLIGYMAFRYTRPYETIVFDTVDEINKIIEREKIK